MADLRHQAALPALPVAADGRHIIDSRGRTVADCPEPSTASFLALAVNLGQAGKIELPPTPDPDANPRGLPSRVTPEQADDGRCQSCGAVVNCLHALHCGNA